MKTNTYAGIFLMLSIPLILLTCNTFADENTIEELHKESAILVSQELTHLVVFLFEPEHILHIFLQSWYLKDQ